MALAPFQPLRGGRYTLVSRLRAGGTGVVWRAVDTRDERIIAVKAVPRDAGGDAAVEHEAEAVARVKHPGALGVLASFVEGDHGFIVMELAACSLADVVEAQGPLPRPVALRVASELCAVLGAAHEAGVVHRDVKPANVLVMADGGVRLGDWGIARVHVSGHGRTRTGALLGTIVYMAPEQKRDPRDVRPATDVYAMAVTLGYMLTGRPPGDLYVPEVLATLRSQVGPELAGVLADAGSYADEARPRNGQALNARLDACGVTVATPDEAKAWLAARSQGLGEDHDPITPGPRREAPASAAIPATAPAAPGAGRVRLLAQGILLVAALLATGWFAWERGADEASARATRDPLAEVPPCPDAPTQWVDRVEKAPKETVDGTIEDIDGDGLLDVMYANQYSETVTLWWGRQGALPSEKVELATGRLGQVPAVGDIDGDGLRDLLVPQYDDARFLWMRGTGPRAWDTGTPIFQEPPPFGVVLADIDTDRRADAVTRHLSDPTMYLRWSRSDAKETLARHQQLLRGGVRGAEVFASAGGVAAWLLDDDAVRVVPVTAAGLTGASQTVELPGAPIDVVRDAGHPEAAVVRLRFGERDVLMRINPTDGSQCRVGEIGVTQSVLALGDLDGDGIVDRVGANTCQFCDSNQVFSRGVR